MAANMKLPFPIIPATDSGISHYAKYGVGGYYSLETDSERENLPSDRLDPGMLVYIKETGKTWRYLGNSWSEVFILGESEYRDLTEWIEED